MRILLAVVLFLLLVAVVALAILGWLYSNRILVPQPYGLLPEFEVLDVAEGTVTLPAPPSDAQFADTRREGVYNLLWQGGYGRLGEVLEDDGKRVVRRLEVTEGNPPSSGDPARLDAFVLRRDPLQDHDIPFENLALNGVAGTLHAWWVDRRGGKAVLMLHGRRRADLTETLRIMPTLLEGGYAVLALAYRNHDQSAPSPDGFYHYGATEWEDVVTGLKFLTAQGVSEVVVYAYSYGGAVALEALKHWPEGAPELRGLVLDSPLLDPRTVFRRGARKLGAPLPGLLTDWAMMVASWRSGIRWQELDQRTFAPTIQQPVLLLGGTADSTIPIELLDEFAQRLPQVVYHRLVGVEHTEGWNQDPEAYQGWVKEFLAGL